MIPQTQTKAGKLQIPSLSDSSTLMRHKNQTLQLLTQQPWNAGHSCWAGCLVLLEAAELQQAGPRHANSRALLPTTLPVPSWPAWHCLSSQL